MTFEKSIRGLLVPALAFFLEATAKPNIILIMADDLGYGDLSAFGSTRIKTPNLDTLAARGMKFTDFHSNGAVCSPTRAALLTGQYQQRWGIDKVVDAATSRDEGLALDALTLAEALRSAGYATAHFGKWHLGYMPKFNPTRQGFDHFRGLVSGNVDMFSPHVDQEGYRDWWRDTLLVPEEGYATTLITGHALDFVEANAAKPFFLYLPYNAPHYPLQGPDHHAFRKDKPGFPQPHNPPDMTAAQLGAAYIRMVETLDQDVGKVMAKVRALGLEVNTLVFFCSDNGPALGHGASSGGLRGSKSQLYEGGHRVPGIAYWPGKVRPAVTDQTAMTMDLYPTFAALAGLSVSGLDGQDLSRLLLSGQALAERTLFWKTAQQAAVRKGDWKLVRDGGVESLYNLELDGKEGENRAGAQPAIKRELLAELQAWEKESAKPIIARVTPASNARFLDREAMDSPAKRKRGRSGFRILWGSASGFGFWRDILGRTPPR